MTLRARSSTAVTTRIPGMNTWYAFRNVTGESLAEAEVEESESCPEHE
jgi:hypothetical protein